MLKCLKPKNNQSLNRILLVLIKKKECIYNTNKEKRYIGMSCSCTHITISNRGGVFGMSVYFEMKYSKQYAEWAL